MQTLRCPKHRWPPPKSQPDPSWILISSRSTTGAEACKSNPVSVDTLHGATRVMMSVGLCVYLRAGQWLLMKAGGCVQGGQHKGLQPVTHRISGTLVRLLSDSHNDNLPKRTNTFGVFCGIAVIQRVRQWSRNICHYP